MHAYKARKVLSTLSCDGGFRHNGGKKYITWGQVIIGSYCIFEDDYWSFDVNQMTYYVNNNEIKTSPAGYCDIVCAVMLKDIASEEDLLTFMIMAEEKAMKMFK